MKKPYENNKWITNDVRNRNTESGKLYKRAIQERNTNIQSEYKAVRNNVMQTMTTEKNKFYIDNKKKNSYELRKIF